jgi:CHAT domain-containing protein
MESLYGAANTRVYTEATADEERIKSEAGNYQVIHIGTHGVLDDDSPMYSYVMLSQGGRGGATAAPSPDKVVLDLSGGMDKDGFLEAWEMMDLELNAQLVVLSACETARGRVGGGEGIVGFSWSLFIAGSPATVVSQWKVDEKSTTELMFSFHENFMSEGRPTRTAGGAAEALQKASLKLMESTEYSHPYYWAGFVLVGDGSR